MLFRPHVLNVIFDEGWKIELVGVGRFGPYATRGEALATAVTWADHARSQGHQVTVVEAERGATVVPLARAS